MIFNNFFVKKIKPLWLLSIPFFILISAQAASAAVITWDGGAGDLKWETATNWSNDACPTSSDDVTINNVSVTFTTGGGCVTMDFSTLAVDTGDATTTSLTLVGNIGTGGSITIKNLGTLTQKNAIQQTISGTLTIESGGTLTHTANSTTALGQRYYVNFSAATIDIQTGSTVNGDAKGYAGGGAATAPGNGPGGGQVAGGSYVSGGGHAGIGGQSETDAGGAAYCNLTNVATMGSGGGSYNSSHQGGAGGGLIILNATGTATLNGTLTADGVTPGGGTLGGGGAGGGIKITANTVAGTPSSLTTTGGGAGSGGYSGGGSGGCIQFNYTTSTSVTASGFLASAAMLIYGGIGGSGGGGGIGGSGTFFVKQTGDGDLVTKNTSTPTVANTSFSNLTFDNFYGSYARFKLPGSTIDTSLTLNNGSVLTVDAATTATLTSAVTSISVTGTAPTINVSGTFNATGLSNMSSVIISVASGGIWGNAGTITSNSSTSITLNSGATISNTFSSLTSAGTLGLNQGATFTITDLVISGGTTTMSNYSTSSALSLSTLNMTGGTLAHTANTTTQTHIVNISATTITIGASATVNLGTKGYVASSSTGANGTGPSGGGGGGGGYPGGGAHGGNGGNGTNGAPSAGGTAYCDTNNVATMGSSGGTYNSSNKGGTGGGLAIFAATGTFTLNGSITAGGGNGGGSLLGGGGAGGGVKITANTVAGTGTISAVGGAGGTGGYTGGGGGGCVYIGYVSSNSITTATLTGGAKGGGAATNGANGVFTAAVTNSAPAATTPGSISQATDGTGYVTFSTTISDADSNNTKLKVEYSDDGGSTWFDPVLVSATPDGGTIDVDNAQTYQIGTVNAIDTSTGNKIITIVWNTQSASNGNGTLDNTSQSDIKVRVTPNDTTTDGTAQASSAFSVDNVDPTISTRVTKDLDGDGYVDAMYITVAESVQDSTISASHFTIAGASGLAFSSTTNSDTADDSDFYITFTDGTLLTNSTANVTYTAGTLKDAYGNSLASVGPTASTDGAGPAILTAVATDPSPVASGVDAGDYVTITFSENTNQLAINASNVNTTFALNNSHSWKDGANAISSATWSSASVLVIIMSAGTSAPTVAIADTITVSSTVTDGTNSASSVAFSAITGTFFNNAAPTVSISSASQKTAGTGTVDIAVSVDDADDNDTVRLKMEYKAGTDCSSGTSDPTFDETNASTTSTYGDPQAENDNEYQIGNSSGWITTSSGANTVNFDWLAETDLSTANGTYCIKITPYDGLSVGTAATTTLTLDNVNPASAGALSLNARTASSITLDLGIAGSDTNITNYKIYYKAGSSGVVETDTLHTTIASGSYNADGTTQISTLSPNTQYVFNVFTYDNYGNTSNPTEVAIYTLANVPGTPTLTASASSMNTVIDVNSNPAATTFAIQVGAQYVQADGTLGASAVWQTYATWGGATGQSITGLSPNVSYTVGVLARNGSNTETAATSASKYTLVNTPATMNIASPTTGALTVTIAVNSNPAATEFKIYETGTAKYVQTTGVLDTSAAWQTAANWGTASGTSGQITVTGLSPNVQYTFQAIAKNGDAVETSASTGAALYTLANVPSGINSSIDRDIGTTLQWTANSNPGTTNYYVEATSGSANNSGWTTSLNWTDTSAKNFEIEYCYRIKARNGDSVETTLTNFDCRHLTGGGIVLPIIGKFLLPDSRREEKTESPEEITTVTEDYIVDQTLTQTLAESVKISNEEDEIEIVIDQETAITDNNETTFSGTISPPVIDGNPPAIKEKKLEDKVVLAIKIETSSKESVYFSKPAVVTFALKDLLGDMQDFDPANLMVYFYNNSEEKYEYVSRLTISPDGKNASFLTYHLSTFVVFNTENTEEEELLSKSAPFFDTRNHWSRSYVNRLFFNGVVSGKTYTKFKPDEEVTRAEFLKMALLSFNYLVKGSENSEFSDIANDFWAIDFIETARENDLVEGYTDGSFKPNQAINRSEAMKILFKTAKFDINTTEKEKSNFIDVDQRAWYVPFVNYAVLSRIVEGYEDGSFRPGQSLTRAEAAKIITETREIWAK